MDRWHGLQTQPLFHDDRNNSCLELSRSSEAEILTFISQISVRSGTSEGSESINIQRKVLLMKISKKIFQVRPRFRTKIVTRS
jgi:hypothetical protein